VTTNLEVSCYEMLSSLLLLTALPLGKIPRIFPSCSYPRTP